MITVHLTSLPWSDTSTSGSVTDALPQSVTSSCCTGLPAGGGGAIGGPGLLWAKRTLEGKRLPVGELFVEVWADFRHGFCPILEGRLLHFTLGKCLGEPIEESKFKSLGKGWNKTLDKTLTDSPLQDSWKTLTETLTNPSWPGRPDGAPAGRS